MLDDSETRDFVSKDGYLSMVMGDDRRLVWYPCANNTLINFLLIHPSKETRAGGAGKRYCRSSPLTQRLTSADWQQKGEIKHLLECGRDFADTFKNILKKAPTDTLKVWTLLDLKVLPHWVKGKLAVLG